MSELYIYGAGGHGAVVAEIAAELGYVVVGFIDDDPERADATVLSWRVLGGRACIPRGANVALGIGNNEARGGLVDQARDLGWDLPVLVHPSAVISPSATLGAGTVAMPQVVVNARTRIGSGCILNTACSVDHDSRVGEVSHIAPGVRIAGGVTIGDHALIGIGSCIRPGIVVGSGCVIGAGSVVVSDVADGATLFGNPATKRRRAVPAEGD